ncbi:MAG: hypothetical protein WA971_10025 [Microbacterium sp.]
MVRSTRSTRALGRALSATGAASLAVAGILILAPAATADEGTVCTPAAAWDEQVLVSEAIPGTPGTDAVTHTEYQRYSWTAPGKNDGEGPGDSTPLNDPDNWQENTTNYEGAGHGTDPVGVAFQQGQGNGSWFYWDSWEVVDTPAVPGTPETPAVYETKHHDAVTCPGVVTPHVTPSNHEVPKKVQTDGDTTGMTLLAGGLGTLGATALAGAGLLTRARRS